MNPTLLIAVDSTANADSVRLLALIQLHLKMELALAASDWRQMMRLDRLCKGLLDKESTCNHQREEVLALIAIKSLYAKMISRIENHITQLARH